MTISTNHKAPDKAPAAPPEGTIAESVRKFGITVEDYDSERTDATDGSKLWESRPPGMPKSIRAGTPLARMAATYTVDIPSQSDFVF